MPNDRSAQQAAAKASSPSGKVHPAGREAREGCQEEERVLHPAEEARVTARSPVLKPLGGGAVVGSISYASSTIARSGRTL